MKVSMSIDSDGVITEVSREYEPEATQIDTHVGPIAIYETPALADVTQAVATAAAIAHRITPKE